MRHMQCGRAGVFAAIGAALLAVGSFGCASHSTGSQAGSASSTGAAGNFTPRSIVLYLARREIAGACRDDLSPSIEFAPSTAELTAMGRVELEKWALCLQRPEMQHAKVVVFAPEDSRDATDALVDARARKLLESIVARGVDASRVIVRSPETATVAGEKTPGNALRVALMTR